MDNVIEANFYPEFRREVYMLIKSFGGPKKTEAGMIADGFHPSFAKAIVRSISRREGW